MKFKSSLQSQYEKPDEEELERNNECIICRDNNTEETSVIMPCGHVFHEDCLKSWIIQKQTCPICNKSLFDFTNTQSSFGNPEEQALKKALKDKTTKMAIQQIQMANVMNLTQYTKLLNLPMDEIDYYAQQMIELYRTVAPVYVKDTEDKNFHSIITDSFKKQLALKLPVEETPMVVGEWEWESKMNLFVDENEEEDIPELEPIEDSEKQQEVMNEEEEDNASHIEEKNENTNLEDSMQKELIPPVEEEEEKPVQKVLSCNLNRNL